MNGQRRNGSENGREGNKDRRNKVDGSGENMKWDVEGIVRKKGTKE